ncbi:hypothetical protein EJB05_13149, partial [Eragrostis curvula]
MDRVVRIFYGGTVNKDGEMVDMRDEVVPFVKAPMFSEIETKAASFVGVRGGLRFRGRFDAGGGGRAHYVLLELGTEDMWLLYKECLKDAQVKIAEVIVDVVGRDGCAAIIPETVMLEDEPADVLTQEGLHVPECHDGSPVGEHVHPLVSPHGMAEYNDFPDNTFEEEDKEREEENNMAPHLRYRLLDTTFDEEHRAHLMVDLGREWQFDDDGSLPTVGYLWKNCINVVGNKERRYLFYMNELDCLTQHQVEWTPYNRHEVMQMQLSPLCYRDKDLWRIEVPLIFYYAVEWHLPQRVMRQFDRLQVTNVPFTPTNKILHKCNRKKERGAVNWAEKHQAYIALWENRVNIRVQPTSGPRHLTVAFNEYLQWFHEVSRVHLKPALSGVAIADLPDSGDEDDLIDDYDAATLATQMGRLANEAAHALRHPQGSAEELGALRSFAQRVRRSCRRLALKLNCIQEDVVVQPQEHEQQPSRTRSRSSTRTRSSTPRNVASSSRANNDSSESEEEDDGDTDSSNEGADEIGPSQLTDAPGSSQPSPPHAPPRRRKDV